MLYEAYEFQKGMLAGASAFSRAGAQWWSSPFNPLAYSRAGPLVASALDVFAHAAAPRGKPAFGLGETRIDGRNIAVVERLEQRTPFGQLRHFVRQGAPEGDPRLLVVAPMSGHFATLLRGTVERLLPSHDIWITDWRDARNVPMRDGRFDLNDYIDHVIGWLGHIAADGPRAHVLAVCQPSVPVLAATALMAASGNRARPATLTMMGGPIDTREAPTRVNTMATERPLAWFEQNAIATVPAIYPGAGRRVYPGFLQLAGFMSMNLGNHLVSHWEMFRHLVAGDDEEAEARKRFYEEYRAVADMTAEFYLQTVDQVFQRHLLPKGEFCHRGERVDPSAIEDVPLMAIEGERDDISGLGQTRAALKLASRLPDAAKEYLMVPGVGHYGIFNGRRWREDIAPRVEAFIRAHERGAGHTHGKGRASRRQTPPPGAGFA